MPSGVRSSALRFWEQQGLLTPERTTRLGARSYPIAAIRDPQSAMRGSSLRSALLRAGTDIAELISHQDNAAVNNLLAGNG